MAKVNNPNDRELWLELLQIKRSRKGSFDEQQIDEIIDRYIDEGLEFKDDAYTGLSKALSTLRKKRKRTQVTKKVLFIFLIMLAVGGLAWAGQKLYGGWKEKRVAQEQTQTAEFITAYNTQVAQETRSIKETSTAWSEQNPTQTYTAIPTPTVTPSPMPTPTPLQFPSLLVRGLCSGTVCSWTSETPIDPGSYALFVKKDTQATEGITENLGEISVYIPNTITIDLRQCFGFDKGESCFIGLVDLIDPVPDVSGGSTNIAIPLDVNLEFVQISQSDETLGDVKDFLIPDTETFEMPICQNGECIVSGSYRPSRQIAPGSELLLFPSQAVEGIGIYYGSLAQSPDQSFTPLTPAASGWKFDTTPIEEGFFVITSPVGSELSEDIVLLVVNPDIPEYQQ